MVVVARWVVGGGWWVQESVDWSWCWVVIVGADGVGWWCCVVAVGGGG